MYWDARSTSAAQETARSNRHPGRYDRVCRQDRLSERPSVFLGHDQKYLYRGQFYQ